MPVESIFEFKFSADTREEGASVAKSIGADMPSKAGFVDVRVIQDVTDPGHLIVATGWDSQDSANTLLTAYNNDAKVKRATELMGHPPTGFVGNLLAQ